MEFYSNGKLLLTGEYVVLNGALSLALPTIYGQHLKVKNNPSNKIKWISYDNNEKIWFNCEFDKDNLEVIFSSSDKISDRLKKIITCIRTINTDFLKLNGSEIITKLTFNTGFLAHGDAVVIPKQTNDEFSGIGTSKFEFSTIINHYKDMHNGI